MRTDRFLTISHSIWLGGLPNLPPHADAPPPGCRPLPQDTDPPPPMQKILPCPTLRLRAVKINSIKQMDKSAEKKYIYYHISMLLAWLKSDHHWCLCEIQEWRHVASSDNCHVRVGTISHLETWIHVVYWIHTVTLIHRFLDQQNFSVVVCTHSGLFNYTSHVGTYNNDTSLLLPLQFTRHVVGSCWRNVSDSMVIVSLAHRQQEIIFVWLKSVFACNFQW